MTQSPEGLQWLPEFAERTDYVPPTLVGQLIAELATGAADQLTGRFIHANDDLADVISTADEIVKADIRRLQLPTSLDVS
jgi:hypothetical protein